MVKSVEAYSSTHTRPFPASALIRPHSVVKVSSWARRVSRRVSLVTGSRIVAQRSSCGGSEEVELASWEIETPPSSLSDSGTSWARDSVCWSSWSVRQRWKSSSASSRSGMGSIVVGV